MSRVPRPTLLAVDDDEGLRESYAVIFEDWAEVVLAESGARALSEASRQSFDAIILDVRMPEMSGVDVFEPLRATQPRTPIIFVTAVDTAETAIRAMRLGAFDYITKPFDMELLVGVVRRAIASTAGVVSVVGHDVGRCAAAAVLAARRADIPIAVGAASDASRTVRADGRSFVELYAEIAPGAPPVSDFIVRVASYVGSHYSHVKVEHLASAVGLSPDRLARVFRDETTMATKEYVTRVRIEVARSLLRETRDSLEVIAERVGLCDAPHLSRVFRQHTGSTPGAYRTSSAPDVTPPDSSN